MKVPETNLFYKEHEGQKVLCISYSQLETFLHCPYQWYKIYVEGMRSYEKQEATSYGTSVHLTVEHFFNQRCRLDRQQMCDTFTSFAEKEAIPFRDIKSQIIAQQHALRFINWISDIYEKRGGRFVKPNKELSAFERMMRFAEPVGVEEDFMLKYKLPEPLDINGKIEDHVYIKGSIDLHLVLHHPQQGDLHYILDWKSGQSLFRDEKLQSNLQHPIYGFYLKRKYGVLPRKCVYLFTRFQEIQTVDVDGDRIRKSVEIINGALKDMYYFPEKKMEIYVSCPRNIEHQPNLRCNPSPLCYWCDFGKYNKNLCPFSSDYVKKDE